MSIFIQNIVAKDKTYTNVRDGTHQPLINARKLCDKLWESFEKFADSDFKTEISNDFDARFWEMDLTCFFMNQNFKLSSASHGPDIVLRRGNDTFHIEAVCPQDGLKQNKIPEILADRGIQKLPDDEIMLRLTSAILSKQRVYAGYLKDQIVKPKDYLIIAINSCQLDGAHMDFSIPRIVRALYPIGHQVINSNLLTDEIEEYFEYSDSVTNANGSPVQTNIFFKEEYKDISAVLYAHYDCCNYVRSYTLIHNPLAINKLELGVFPVSREYYISDLSDDSYKIMHT
jgi:hypothetical protein